MVFFSAEKLIGYLFIYRTEPNSAELLRTLCCPRKNLVSSMRPEQLSQDIFKMIWQKYIKTIECQIIFVVQRTVSSSFKSGYQ